MKQPDPAGFAFDVFARRAIAKFTPSADPPDQPNTVDPVTHALDPPMPTVGKRKTKPAPKPKRVFPMVRHDPVLWAAYLRAKFIARANVVHGNRYDYTESVHVDAHTKLWVRCPEHGLFKLQPTVHTSRKVGCFQCGVNDRRAARLLAKQEGAHPTPKVVPKLDSSKFDQPTHKEPKMSIRNSNGTITVQDVIRGRTIVQSYRSMNVYQARAAFAAYVRKTQGESHYA